MAEIRTVFVATKIGTIAGSYITQGHVTRNALPSAARQRGHLHGRDRVAAPHQGRRQGSQGRLRVRYQAQELQRHQGRRQLEVFEIKEIARTL
jgi:translation initiation factor IF-2